MKITAMIDRGHLANQLNRLAKVMGQTITEVVRLQARLVTRDCIKYTPPFTGSPYAPATESFKSQYQAGAHAIAKDIGKVYIQADRYKILTRAAEDQRMATYVAKIAQQRDGEKLRGLFQFGDLQRVREIVNRADAAHYNKFRRKTAAGRGRVHGRPGVLLHEGTVPAYYDGRGDTPNDYGGMRSLWLDRCKLIGLGKAGWLNAAVKLGGRSKLWAPWIKRHKGRGDSHSIFKWNGEETDKPVVTVGNSMPHVQQAGQEFQIVEKALRDRKRNLPKQIQQAIRAQRRAREIGIK